MALPIVSEELSQVVTGLTSALKHGLEARPSQCQPMKSKHRGKRARRTWLDEVQESSA